MQQTHLLPNVDHLTPSLTLVELGIERFIALLVMLDPLPKVPFSLQRVLPVIVRVARSDFDGNVGRNHGRVGADRLDEEELEARLALDARFERFSTRASRVGRVCQIQRGPIGP